MHQRRGFTLLEVLLTVAIATTLVAISLPSLVNSRKSANESSAVASLRALNAVNQQYRTRFQSYARSLRNLSAAGYIDRVLASGRKSGYSFAYTFRPTGWDVRATPVLAGNTGDRGFYVDQTGVLRSSAAGRATSASRPLD